MGGRSDLDRDPTRSRATGFLVKNPRFKTKNSVYDLRVGTNGDTIIIKDLVKVFDNANHSAFTRMISLGLAPRSKHPICGGTTTEGPDSDMFSFVDALPAS